MANFIENLVEKAFGEVTERRQYREYKERVKTLPKNYRAAVEALERYLLVRGSQSKQDDALVPMLVDLVEQFEQAATDSTPIRTVVGEDPAQFAETLLSKYPDDEGISVERDRLVEAIDRAAGEDAGDHEPAR